MMYKFSKFNICFDHKDHTYLYNTLSTALVQLDDQIVSCVKENRICDLDENIRESMKLMKFITDENINETDVFIYHYDQFRYGHTVKTFSITLIPTYNCNLACPYCMQGHSKSSHKMTSKEIDIILLFMEKYIEEHNSVKTLQINLFGGEPMLYKEILYEFCDRTFALAQKYSLSCNYQMTSNMTLLDEQMISYIEKYEIGIQISIDGTPEQHDRKRIYKDGSGTYQLILDNLRTLCEKGLKDLLTIRVNIDETNIHDCEKVMNVLVPYSDDVYFGFIDTFKGSNDNFGDCIPAESYPTHVTETFSKCYKKFNMVNPKLFGRKTPCSMNSEGKFYIDSNLDVYKCETLVKRVDGRIGYLKEDGTLCKEHGFYSQSTFSPAKNKDCHDCVLLPMCAGGCPAKVYIAQGKKDGNLQVQHCMYTYEQVVLYLKNFIDDSKEEKSC